MRGRSVTISGKASVTKPRTRVAAVAVTAALFAAAGCGGGDGSSAGGDGCAPNSPYKIGGLLGLTGSYAALGENEQKAMDLYAKQVNAAGGVNGHPIELEFADTTSSESEAVNQLRRLATQAEVIGVVGPSSSGEGIAVKPISASLEVPVVVPASSNDIVTPLDEAQYMFKEFPATADSLNAQLTYVQEQGWKRVAILAANNGYGQEPVEALPSVITQFEGLELVASETFPPDATDVTAQLSAVARSAPDVVLVWAVNPANAVVARNAATMGFSAVLFHSPGAATPVYLEVAGESANGTLVQGSKIAVPDSIEPADSQHEVVTEFVEAWRAGYGSEPNQYAANGWDSMLLLEEALQAANVSPCDLQEGRDQLRTSLEQNTKAVAGINAVYTFGPDQHGPVGIEGLAVLGVANGAFQLEQGY